MIYHLESELYSCIKSVSHTFNSRVSPITDPCIFIRQFTSFLMHKFGSLKYIATTFNDSKLIYCWHIYGLTLENKY